jgi:hypothetical protein
MYQTSSEPKQEKEERKQDEDGTSGCRSDKCRKQELTYTLKGDREKKFQNNYKALASVPQAKIDQHKADKVSCWHCGRNSYHTLECLEKKTSKGIELATTVAAVMKKAKHQ